MTESATFAAEVDGRRVLCRIEAVVLRQWASEPAEEPMEVLAEHRPVIYAAAKRLIEGGTFQEDGSVLIDGRDLGTA